MYLEPKVEPAFHPDSYGYRPKRSALDAVGRCRERCWSFDWVIDLDIQKFFDTVPWDLVLRAVERHTGERWILLYVKRWLHAPLCGQDGTLTERTMGTPQGSAISPLLANLFMHVCHERRRGVGCRYTFLRQCCVVDEGFVALRHRPAGGGVKPPRCCIG